MEEKPSYYAIIPAEVRYDKDLKDKAKLLYGEIVALSDKLGYCYATNNYFAELYGISKTAVSLLIKELIDKNYIKSEIIYKEGRKEILNRYLSIVKDPYLTKVKDPYLTKVKDNNTSINNTSNNNKKENKKRNVKYIELEQCNEMINNSGLSENINRSIKEWFEHKTQKGEHYTEIGFKKLLTQIKNNTKLYGETEIIGLIDNCIVRNYQGIIFDIIKNKPKKVEREEKDFHYVN